jgi:hypothetical protein
VVKYLVKSGGAVKRTALAPCPAPQSPPRRSDPSSSRKQIARGTTVIVGRAQSASRPRKRRVARSLDTEDTRTLCNELPQIRKSRTKAQVERRIEHADGVQPSQATLRPPRLYASGQRERSRRRPIGNCGRQVAENPTGRQIDTAALVRFLASEPPTSGYVAPEQAA